VLARIEPYRCTLTAGAPAQLELWLRNPHRHSATAHVQVVAPAGWQVEHPAPVLLAPSGEQRTAFSLTPSGPACHRARIAADVTIDDLRLGQHAEALLDITDPDPPTTRPGGPPR